ncbi:MAG: hypothetical protein FJ349_05145 [Sphingomonadales bacterium]|nr:hypothetical protein [Sphingomonadales bacterium]
MELLNLPLKMLNELFGNGAFFSNWVSFFIANWMALALGGYILSKWMSKSPQGLIDRDALAQRIAQESSWYAPLSIIAIALSVVYNVGVYALFLLLEATTFVTNFVYKWVSTIVLWLWNEVFKPSVWLLAKLAFHYLIKWPFQLLLAVIHAVPGTLNRQGYVNVFWPTLYGAIASGLLVFIGFLTDQQLLVEYGPLFALSLALVWVVASTIYQSKDAAMKSLRFSLTIMAILVAIFGVFYFLNIFDGNTKWGGILSGILHAPNVVAATIIVLTLLALLYLTNVGVIFSNEHASDKWSENIYEYIKTSFNHSLAFVYQPILVVAVSVVVIILPWAVLEQGANFATANWVENRLSAKTKAINDQLDQNQVLNKVALLINPDSTKNADFDTALETLQNEVTLRYELAENKRYTDYLSSALIFGTNDLKPIITAADFDSNTKANTEELEVLRGYKKSVNANYNDQLKSLDDQIVDINATINSNPDLAEFYMPMRNNLKSLSKTLSISKERHNRFLEMQIAATQKVNERFAANWMSYCLTYLLLLIANYALLAIVIAFVFNLYAHTVKPIYDAHNGSRIVAAIDEEQSKNNQQPWLAWLVLAALLVVYFQWNSLSDTTSNQVDSIMKMLEELSGTIVQ